MTKKQKFTAWFLIIMSYVSTYGAALSASYIYLAKDIVKSESFKGGGFLYFVVGVIVVTFVVSVTKLINKMKANGFKTLFKSLMKIGVLLFLSFFVRYIAHNFEALYKVLGFTIFGLGLGTTFEMIVVTKYKDYIQEVGIL